MKGAQKVNLKSPIGPGPNGARQVYLPGGMQVNMGQMQGAGSGQKKGQQNSAGGNYN